MIETGEVKNQSELAKKLGISQACVCQVLAILKLDGKSMLAIKQTGNPIHGKIVSRSMLSKYLKNPELHKKNKHIFNTVVNCLYSLPYSTQQEYR